MFKNGLWLKIIIFLALSDVLETFTQFCFKKCSLNQQGFFPAGPADILIFIKNTLPCGFLWAGLASVILTFIIWSSILSKIDLSIAVPIASLSYILVPLVSLIFLGEKIVALRWVGIFLILTGVIFVSTNIGKKDTS